jgi:BMFP domain-containing protein YqiC
MRSAREKLKLFEDITRMTGGAFGSLGGIRQQVKAMVKEGLDRMMDEMHLVTRKEFERVEMIALKARERQEELEDRLKKLEGGSRKTAKAPLRKTTAKRKKR